MTSLCIMEMNKNKIAETLYSLFNRNGDRTFLIDANNKKEISYSDFIFLVNKYICFLKDNDVCEGDCVAYLCHNSYCTLALYFACMVLGVIVAPIDELKGEFEQKELLKLLNYKLYINYDNLETVSNHSDTVSFFIDFYNIDYNKPWLITFTSGSTAVPKGVIHSFENLFYSGNEFGNRFNLSSENVFYHNFPMAYMAGILNTFIMPMIFGCKIIVSLRQSIQTAFIFWEEIKHFSCNTVWFNPTFIAILLKVDRTDIGKKYAKDNKILSFVGTAPLNIKLKEEFENRYGFELYESYGLSETLFLTTNYYGNNIKGSVGKTLDSVKLLFGYDGEISAIVPWIFKGYVNSKERIENFKTGDIGMNNDGYVYITGRKKDIIIRGGINISPYAIEKILDEYLNEFVVLGLQDNILGEKTVCFYVSSNNPNPEKEINSKLLKELGKDYLVDRFIKLDELPKNINGKIDRIKLKEEYNDIKY